MGWAALKFTRKEIFLLPVPDKWYFYPDNWINKLIFMRFSMSLQQTTLGAGAFISNRKFEVDLVIL